MTVSSETHGMDTCISCQFNHDESFNYVVIQFSFGFFLFDSVMRKVVCKITYHYVVGLVNES